MFKMCLSFLLRHTIIGMQKHRGSWIFFKEILMEEPGFFKEILSEILEEYQVDVPNERAERRVRLKAATKKVFDKYDEVFKALA